MARNALIQLRRDTAANWTSVNPTLAAGEMGFETDTGKLKIGTGSTAWTSLLYTTDASDITGATLASNVVSSSLTSVGTLGSLAVTGDITRGGVSLPRGVMAFTKATTSGSIGNNEQVQITGSSFTAVANRYYKITYYEPSIDSAFSETDTAIGRIRLTNLAGAVQQTAKSFIWYSSTPEDMTCVAVTTLTAGTVNLVATLEGTTGFPIGATRSATQYAFLLVEDIGAV